MRLNDVRFQSHRGGESHRYRKGSVVDISRREQCVQSNTFRRMKQKNNAAVQKSRIGEVITRDSDASKGMNSSVDSDASSMRATLWSDAETVRLLYQEG